MAKKKKSNPDDKWEQPKQPPPPLFLGEKERNLTKQVNDELIERVIGQTILYYPLDLTTTNYHPLYGEAIVKNFLPPVRVHVLVNYDNYATEMTDFGVDRKISITVKFHHRRLTEDQNVYVREGDFVLYGDQYYEIVQLNEPKQLFGQIDQKFEIEAKCIKARQGLFNAQ